MEQKNRTILVIAIAITVLAAVFVSFGLPFFSDVPEVKLPDVSQKGAGELGGKYLPVEITPETVQNVIETLSRTESYSRELTVTLFWGESGSSSDKVQIWADSGYVNTTVNTGGVVHHLLVGDDRYCLWYGGDKTWKELPARDGAGDLAQRIPTYETVLELDASRITAAGYEQKNGKDCIYVQCVVPELESRDNYWIETGTGLLCAAETWENGKKVYEMAETSLQSPLEEGYEFALPDGTVLHTVSAAVQQ